MKRLLSIVCIILTLTIGLSVSVCAEPTDTFTHVDTANGKVTSVLATPMYSTSKVINASTLGLNQSLLNLNDLCCGKDGRVYLLIAAHSKIVVLNEDYTLNRVMTIVENNEDGELDDVSFSQAKGIYIDENNDIYICDTFGGRVIVANNDGVLKETWETPDSSLLPKDFVYQPSRMVKDNKGYVYVLSLGCYYGALSYDPSGKFIGFYGANNVQASALDTLSFIWDKLTQTDAKKSTSVKKLPYAFVDLCLDSKGYMITCTGSTLEDKNGEGQIRKLSPGGEDILYKRNTRGVSSTSSSVNFVEEKVTKKFGVSKPQNINSIDVDEKDFIYAIDSTHGLIYIYDNECNMLGGFAGGFDRSKIKGLFDTPTSIKVHGNDVLVLDSDNNSLTVFCRTQYGQLLIDAQKLHLKGEYDRARPYWEKVISENSSCQLAYRGMAIAAYTDGEFEKSLDYAKKGLDYTTYDLAWKVVFSNRVSDNFTLIFILALAVIIGLISASVVIKKKNIVLIKNERVKLALSSITHPFKAFEEIRYKDMGSLPFAFVLLALYYIASMLNETVSGFLFLNSEPRTYNTFYTILSTIGLVVLWSFANWLIACLSAGKGRLKDVFIVSCYCTIPMTVFTFARVILSQFLSLSGLAVVDAVGTAVLIFTLFILCIAIMQVHEFDFFKFLSTTIVTILFMILVISVLLLVGVLLQQVGEFIYKLYNEAVYR